jgi:hypothetical protein
MIYPKSAESTSAGTSGRMALKPVFKLNHFFIEVEFDDIFAELQNVCKLQ